jgi:hypothetical protein
VADGTAIATVISGVTAITGIIVAGVVGPNQSARAAALQSQRTHEHNRLLADRAHEHNRVLADREELRKLLDEAEVAMLVGERIAITAPDMIGPYPSRSGPYPDQLREFHEAMREIDGQRGRLTLRIGPDDPVAAAYQTAFNAIERLDETLSYLPRNVVIGEAEYKKKQSDVQQCIETVQTAHDEFLAGATALVASQLEPRPSERAS